MFSKVAVTSLAVLVVFGGLGVSASAQEPGAATAGPSEENPLVVEGKRLLEGIGQKRGEIAALREERDGARGEERILFERRLLRLGLDTLADVDALVKNVFEQESEGLDASRVRQAAEDLVGMLAPVARQRIDSLEAEISRSSGQRESTTGEELIKLENQLAEANEKLNTILGAALDNARHMEELGLAAAEEEAYLAEKLSNRAETSAERIRLSVEQITSLQKRVKEKPDDPDLMVELSAAEAKRDASKTDLAATIEMMDRLELETAE